MNIFVLDNDVSKCAQYHTDRHVVKMILESVQLLCSAHHTTGTKVVPYRLSHKNHPCAKWVRDSMSNYLWLCSLAKELCKEYTYRYGKVHKSSEVLKWCMNNFPNINDIGLTSFYQAMPKQYQNENVVIAYRNYYNGAKKHLFRWTKRNTPDWIEKERK